MDRPVSHRRQRLALTLPQLLTFSQLAHSGSFTRTATALGLSQPAISQHVRAVERYFGIRLVDLIGRRVVLTAAGKFFADRAVRILESIAATEREMRHYNAAETGELRLGSTITIGSYTLTPLLQRFRAKHPGVVISVMLQNTKRIAEMVKGRELDLALVEGAYEDEELESFSYAQDKLSLVVPPNHKFARVPQQIAISSLADEPFIAREVGSGNRTIVDEAFSRAGITARVILELGSAEATARAVAAGIGISIISSIVTDPLVGDGKLVRVPIQNVSLTRSFRIIRLRNFTPSPTVDAFMGIVLSELADTINFGIKKSQSNKAARRKRLNTR
jgi:DNA-binding transcriptional LysR family regulator